MVPPWKATRWARNSPTPPIAMINAARRMGWFSGHPRLQRDTPSFAFPQPQTTHAAQTTCMDRDEAGYDSLS